MTNSMIPILLSAATLTALLYLLLWPVPIDPEPWSPPEAPDPPAENGPGAGIRVDRLPVGGAPGPEDVAVDEDGALRTGTRDGAIRRVHPDTGEVEVLARTRGRPLGLAFGSGGELFICDVRRGLLSLSSDGHLRTRVDRVEDERVTRANGIAVASDGTVYFTDSSARWRQRDRPADVMEHRPHGRLLAYDPDTDESRIVAGGLYFPNGVALSEDESSALVVETSKYRIRRVGLSGSPTGSDDVFVHNLPGFPDGISRDGDRYWVGLVSPRTALFDRVLLPRPGARKVLYRLPGLPRARGARPGGVVRLDASGNVSWSLHPGRSDFASVTNVRRHGDDLYLGSTTEDAIGRIPRPDEHERRGPGSVRPRPRPKPLCQGNTPLTEGEESRIATFRREA